MISGGGQCSEVGGDDFSIIYVVPLCGLVSVLSLGSFSYVGCSYKPYHSDFAFLSCSLSHQLFFQ